MLSTLAYASTLPTANVIFVYEGAGCGTDGSVTINMSHSGEAVDYSDINITVTGDYLNAQPVQGLWYRGSYPVTNYEVPFDKSTDQDFVSSRDYQFVSNPGIYTTGTYKFTVSWPSSTIYYDHFNFAVYCPGIRCATNDSCISQQACTNGLCSWTDCNQDSYAMGHTCFNRCTNNTICTKSYYINDQCIYVQKDGCCINNNDCPDTSYQCVNNKCVQPIYQSIFSQIISWLRGI